MVYTCGDAKESHGVRVVLGPHVRESDTVRYVDNQMIMVMIQGKKVDLVIAQIYRPHSGLARLYCMAVKLGLSH